MVRWIQINILLLGYVAYLAMGATDVSDLYPEVKNNLTKVTWAHAVNSQKLLEDALADESIMMIEADVSLGTWEGEDQPVDGIPIMAHPSGDEDLRSDLSLELFLNKIKDFNVPSETGTDKKAKKGIKLDFKSTEAFEASVEYLDNVKEDDFPVWLNADILKGPIDSQTEPVDADTFLEQAKQFSGSVLSIGWTTTYTSDTAGSYTDAQIGEMIEEITQTNITQTITFPVRAVLAVDSIDELVHLLNATKSSTITIWSPEDEEVDPEKLTNLIAKVGLGKTYIDVPEDLLGELDLSKLSNSSARFAVSIMSVMLTALLVLISY